MGTQSFSKSEIDRLGDRLRAGETEPDLRMLDEYRQSFANAYANVTETTRKLSQLEVTGRPAKSTTAIVEKLRRESIRLSQMQDIAGCRVLVKDLKSQNALVKHLEAAFVDVVIVDRRAQPSHGYRAVHLVVTSELRTVEIQVRTTLQHFWALLSEKVADKLGNAIKYGRGDPAVQQQLEGLSASVANGELLRHALMQNPETSGIIDLNDAHIKSMGKHLLIALGVENDFLD